PRTTKSHSLSLHDALPISRPSRKVLAEIENRLTGRCLPDRDGLELAYPSHGRSFGGHKPRRRRIQQDDGSPPGIVEGHCGPAGPDRKSTRLNSSHDQISYA